jgi:hypothetical protein
LEKRLNYILSYIRYKEVIEDYKSKLAISKREKEEI